MTQQEIVERDVRLALGDLTLQLIVARAEAQSLREQIEMATPKDSDAEERKAPKAKPNGKEAPPDEPHSRPQ